MNPAELCPGCGVALSPVAGATHPYMESSAACWAMYGAVLEREYSEATYMAVHRLTVDAYAVQHPGRPEPRSIQSVNVHLLGLHLALERRLSHAFATRALKLLADRMSEELTWLAPPASRGARTVADVIGSRSAAEHGVAVEAWAADAWTAWAAHHARIRGLAERVLARL